MNINRTVNNVGIQQTFVQKKFLFRENIFRQVKKRRYNYNIFTNLCKM